MPSTEFSVAKPPPTCYNSTVRRVGISVLQRLPKPLRRVRLPYPAPKRKTPSRVSFSLEQGFCCAKSFACERAAERARAAACTPSPPPTAAARACRAASASRSLWSLRRSSDYIWSHIRKRETAVRSPVFCYRRRAAIKRSRLPMVKRRSSSVRAAAWGQVHSAG